MPSRKASCSSRSVSSDMNSTHGAARRLRCAGIGAPDDIVTQKLAAHSPKSPKTVRCPSTFGHSGRVVDFCVTGSAVVQLRGSTLDVKALALGDVSSL